MKLCKKCLNTKDESEFRATKIIAKKTGKPYLVSYCHPCEKDLHRHYELNPANQEKRKKYKNFNQERDRKKARESYQSLSPEEKKRRIEVQKEWKKNNQEKIKSYRKTRDRKDRKYNRLFKNITKRMFDAVSLSISKTIGLDSKEFKSYIESKFLPGMTWENYGNDWHIDHIRPCASFNLSLPEQWKEVNHYTNLQPLWAKENLTKSDKYTPELSFV